MYVEKERLLQSIYDIQLPPDEIVSALIDLRLGSRYLNWWVWEKDKLALLSKDTLQSIYNAIIVAK